MTLNLIQVMSTETPSRLNLIGTMKRISLVTSKCEWNFLLFHTQKKRNFRSKRNLWRRFFSLRTEGRRENRKKHISLEEETILHVEAEFNYAIIELEKFSRLNFQFKILRLMTEFLWINWFFPAACFVCPQTQTFCGFVRENFSCGCLLTHKKRGRMQLNTHF